MKTPISTLFVAGLFAAMAAAPRAGAQSTNDRVRIEVRVQSDSDRKDLKGTTADTVTQNKILNITISGKAKSPETRTGKWTAYGRTMKGKDITVLDSGEFKIDLASGPQRIESKRITTTSTPEHSVVSGSGRSSRSRVKKVEGEGTKYIGYSVVVKDGATVVGETADPTGILKEAEK